MMADSSAGLLVVSATQTKVAAQIGAYDLSSYKCKFLTSARLPEPLIAKVQVRWPGNLIDLYGMIEGGVSVASIMAGYQNLPDKTSELLWRDEEGARFHPVRRYGAVRCRWGVATAGPQKRHDHFWRVQYIRR